MGHRVWTSALIAAAAVTGAAAAAPKVPAGSVYVALGSSYAAGPGVAEKAADSPGRCGQSAENYARQVARKLDLKLVDRSCGGATTADILGGGPLGLAPQLDGLSPEARLVTVTVGGNDVRYMAGLSTAVCRKDPQVFPEAARPRACASPAGFDLDQAFGVTEANMRAIVAEVRRRAPQARLVFVDYITVLPAGPPCERLRLSAADKDELKARADRLARLTATVARAADAELVKASDLSRGHDACAAEPWVEGFVAPTVAPGSWSPVSFHPKLPAMTAIAGALAQTLR